jgi:hypothetical protein
MLGDVGGLQGAIWQIFTPLVSLFSSHLFSIDQVKRIFKARKGSKKDHKKGS